MILTWSTKRGRAICDKWAYCLLESLLQVPCLSGKAKRRWSKIDTHPLFTWCLFHPKPNCLWTDITLSERLLWVLIHVFTELWWRKAKGDEGWIRMRGRRFSAQAPRGPHAISWILGVWGHYVTINADAVINIVRTKQNIQCSEFSRGLINAW